MRVISFGVWVVIIHLLECRELLSVAATYHTSR
jgi:hypothetical protein